MIYAFEVRMVSGKSRASESSYVRSDKFLVAHLTPSSLESYAYLRSGQPLQTAATEDVSRGAGVSAST